MTQYKISNRTSGTCLGTYDAVDERAAAEAMNRESGYRDSAHAAEVLGVTADELLADLLIEEAVS